MLKDFTPTKEVISLHGLGFIQVVLEGNQRLHVWHPKLPRRSCYEYSAIHNHRFSFRSTVLKGKQVNVRVVVEPAKPGDGTHNLISHDGPRSEKGGRLSYIGGEVNIFRQMREVYTAGSSYDVGELDYHFTPNDGIVVTLLKKTSEGTIHSSSLIEKGHKFEADFDRFQLSPDELFSYVKYALMS